MKIFDCFMYFDEELILDVRLNTLNEFVDYFVIVESNSHIVVKKEIYNLIIKSLRNLKIKLFT